MSTGTIIAIGIVVISVIILLTAGVISYKQMKPTLENVKKLNAAIQHTSKFYTRESENLNERIKQLSLEAGLMESEIQEKSLHFQDFAHKQDEFQASIRYLQNHAGEYSKGIATNIKEEVKEEGPKVIKSFKLAIKKTIKKQKARRKNKRESWVVEWKKRMV